MRCVVTAGPTYETLDKVRRLTNFSTGRLGAELANFLAGRGHDVTLLMGQGATHAGERQARLVKTFTTTSDLSQQLEGMAGGKVDAILHAAAVSDFQFGKVWLRTPEGSLKEVASGKISTRQGVLMAELKPTPKLLARFRDWFPMARLVGWKYEVDGDRAACIRAAEEQVAQYRTDACVANGPAYGLGFGLITKAARPSHFRDRNALFEALEKMISEFPSRLL